MDKKLTYINFKTFDINKFPSIKMIKKHKNVDSLLEPIIVLANDELVNLFLLKKINFNDINDLLQKLISMKDFKRYIKKNPSNIKTIISLNTYIRKIINKMI